MRGESVGIYINGAGEAYLTASKAKPDEQTLSAKRLISLTHLGAGPFPFQDSERDLWIKGEGIVTDCIDRAADLMYVGILPAPTFVGVQIPVRLQGVNESAPLTVDNNTMTVDSTVITVDMEIAA